LSADADFSASADFFVSDPLTCEEVAKKKRKLATITITIYTSKK